jgi:hypothetical protein
MNNLVVFSDLPWNSLVAKNFIIHGTALLFLALSIQQASSVLGTSYMVCLVLPLASGLFRPSLQLLTSSFTLTSISMKFFGHIFPALRKRFMQYGPRRPHGKK